MPAHLVEGDILLSAADVVVHQTNCVTRKAHGLSEKIARKWPCANIYALRTGTTPNTAAKKDEGVPGSCTLLNTNVERPFRVACLMGQLCPGNGKSDYWCKRYGKCFADDNAQRRLRYFQNALNDLAGQLKQMPSQQQDRIVAFPFRIACGLAGGCWTTYSRTIHAFADDMIDNGWKTHIYKQKE